MYTDPTGHAIECGLLGGDCDSGNNGPSNPIPPDENNVRDDEDDNIEYDGNNIDIPNWLDEWLWYAVPSAVGIHIGFTGQVDAGPGAGMTPWEGMLLFNWRSGEISLISSRETFGYFGSPGLFGGNVYIGTTTVKGLSENQNYEGYSVFGGIIGSIDAFGKLGCSLIGGRPVSEDNSFFIDKVSNQPIEYHQVSITVGGNLIPNGVELGGLMGGSHSTESDRIFTFPNWPLR